ncbi:hypothetical protein PLESTB_001125500 [Pleodorina starrii]|uniref:Uncharacterized protein n=1 Tax=Pleodorina starrii TaxID=330485 RepID=A0A9W6BSA9_9CHLO|nr:hypothetical protein PLESTM_001362900 [Pleodorina starrii]GLC56601.1 hypothetical protein PLESTB_001125500 [Pleodorina starrii]GLC76189.1 hypothetical protein PLESTF_001747700 [Pleodorina starrii]
MRGNANSKIRRASHVQDVRELAAQHPGKVLNSTKCDADLDARSVLEQTVSTASSSSALTTCSRSAFTLSSPSQLALEEEDARQLSPQRGNTPLSNGLFSNSGQCASPMAAGVALSSGTGGNATVRPQRLNRLYLKPLASVQSSAAAVCASLDSGLGGDPASANPAAAGAVAATAATTAGGIYAKGSRHSSSSGSSNRGGDSSSSGGDGASTPAGSYSCARRGGSGSTRRKRLAPVNLRVTSSPMLLPHAAGAIFPGASAVVGATASVVGSDAAEEAGDDLLSDEGEPLVAAASDPIFLAGPRSARNQPSPAAPPTPAATTAVAFSRQSSPVDAVAAKQPLVDPVARLVLMRPLEAAADTPKYGAGGFLVAPGHDAAWPPADSPREAPAYAEPGAAPVHGLAALTPAPSEAPMLSGRHEAALGPEAPARGGGACRIHMKLHSSNPEQLRPSMLEPLARLLLPYGWSMRGLAVRAGCLELVLEYTRLEGATEAGGAGDDGGAAVRGSNATLGGDAAAGAGSSLAIPDSQVAELVSYLHRQGLVDPSLEPAVAVQVNQQMRRVQWQGHGGGGGGGEAVHVGRQAWRTGPSSDLPSWCTDAAALDANPSQGTVAPAAAAAAFVETAVGVLGERLAPPLDAGGWLCQQVAPAHVPAADAALHMQPAVAPGCVVASCAASAPVVVLYVAVPCSGWHSVTVRCLGGYLPVQQLHHLSALAVQNAAAAAAAAGLMAVQPALGPGSEGGDVAPPAIDWASAATAAAAADTNGEVFIIQVGGLPSHCALLQVELRAGAGAESWSSHVSGLEQGPQLQAVQSQQLTGTLLRAAEQPPQPPVACTQELLSAAAPVLLLHACTCASAGGGGDGLGAGYCRAGCRRGHSGAAAMAGAITEAHLVAGVCSQQEAAGAAQELVHLQARVLASHLAAAGLGVSGEVASTMRDTASEAARQFISDLGLLLDAAACAGLEDDDALEDRDLAASRDTPSYSREVRGLLFQQLGLGGGGAVSDFESAGAVLLLRQHLADTAVTLLAGCVELSLPHTARLVVDCAARWLRLCSLDMLVAAVASEGGEASAALLDALLRATERRPAMPPLTQTSNTSGRGGSGGDRDGGANRHADEPFGGNGSRTAAVSSVPTAALVSGAAVGAPMEAVARGLLPPRALSGDPTPVGDGSGLAVVLPGLGLAMGGAVPPFENRPNLGPAARPAPRPNLSAGALGSARHPHSTPVYRRCQTVDEGSLNGHPGAIAGPELGSGPWSGSLGQAPVGAPTILSQPALLGMLQPQAGSLDGPPALRNPCATTSSSLPFPTPPSPRSLQPVRYKRFDAAVFEQGAAAAVAAETEAVTAAPPRAAGGAEALAATAVPSSAPELEEPEEVWQDAISGPAAAAESFAGQDRHTPPTGASLQQQQQQRCGQDLPEWKRCGQGYHVDGGSSLVARRELLAPVAALPAAVVAPVGARAARGQATARTAPGASRAAAALLREFGSQVRTSFTGFASPQLEQAFWLETTARLQTMCHLYAVITLAFVSLSVARAFFEDGAAAAAFMAAYQGGQALLLAAFGLMGDGRPERLFSTVVASTALRAVCHALLSRRLAPLPSFVLPMCRIWVDVFNEGVAKAVFEQLPVWLFLTLMIFLELPTAFALYLFLDGNGAGQLCSCLLLRLACFGSLKTAVVVGTQAAWRMRFLARRRGQPKLD